MAAPYHRSEQRYSTRNHFVEPPSITSRTVHALPAGLVTQFQHLFHAEPLFTSTRSTRGQGGQWKRYITFRTFLNVPNLLILIWFVVLLWGERWVFNDSVAACDWKNWERWPPASTPHHLILLADPQLIDPHTYPGRPWPLSSFTIWHTDNYLYRSYYRLQQNLHPDTLFFLGDLFDGGREWGTWLPTTETNNEDSALLEQKRPSREKGFVRTWKSYGDTYWLKEYNRFGRIFFKYWNIGGENPGLGQRGRKIIASLPGNHDLGFGEDIQVPIRNRFNAYFGDGNRVDVIGNHSFVSVDSVSLSAGGRDKEISEPVETFLANVQLSKRKAIARELRYQRQETPDLISRHVVESLETANFTARPSLLDEVSEHSDFPTILLTHVPLYRKVGEPCGPLRERHPPTPHPENTPPVNPDEPNAISISAGFQYQNVLGEQDSKRLISTVGNVISVFSGDDHDYCDIIHQDKNNVREITIKSMSYAMGVRKPGFMMLSMWNPVDASGHTLNSVASGHGAPASRSSTATIQTHLCLLPDQLAILIRYGILVVISVGIILINAILNPFLQHSRSQKEAEDSLLPISSKDVEAGYQSSTENQEKSHSSTSSTSAGDQHNGLAVRSSRTRSVSPGMPGGYGVTTTQNSDYYLPSALPQNKTAGNSFRSDEYRNGKTRSFSLGGVGKKETTASGVVRRALHDILRVTWVVVLIFLWLAFFG